MKNIIFELSDVFLESVDLNCDNVDQEEILGQICMNRTAGIAYKNIYKYPIDWKNEFKNTLKTLYENNVKRSKKYKQFVAELSEILKNADFEYALLKGAYLSTVLYEEGMRTSNDIDILIHEDDIEKCQGILCDNGFVQGYVDKDNNIIKASRREIIMSRMNYGETVPFVKKIGNDVLELDINFSLDFKPEIDKTRVKELLAHRIQINYEGSSFYTLDLYDFFIHLCCHLYKEATTLNWVEMERDLQLYKFSDINLFFMKVIPALNCDELVKRIKKYGTIKECYYTAIHTGKIYQNICELKCYKEIIEKIMPSDLDFMRQIFDPTNEKIYCYDMSFEEWFFIKDKLSYLKEV